MWAERSADPARTTNSCESFHARYNSFYYKAHPDFPSFVAVLKRIFRDSKISINSANRSMAKPRSKTAKKIAALEKNISELLENYNDEALFHFIRTVSRRNSPNVFFLNYSNPYRVCKNESSVTSRKVLTPRVKVMAANTVHYDVRGRSLSEAKHWSEPEPLGLGQRASFSASGDPAVLLVDQVRLEDEGVYRCRVDFQKTPTRNFQINLTVIGKTSQQLIYF
ncbi:unnamed protein product [Bemisia tabaci]|uniref:Ig-like domain-containing protein n=1 Tax=Bemisia tabaci TaxID=7038 RepID=A0A9P0F997_BEMTA|nr:unnamed protein product [Bemisia tabaci]